LINIDQPGFPRNSVGTWPGPKWHPLLFQWQHCPWHSASAGVHGLVVVEMAVSENGNTKKIDLVGKIWENDV